MKLNITSLAIRIVNINVFEIKMTSEKHEEPTSYYIMRDAIPFMIERFEGTASFYPFLNDVTSLIQPHTEGIRSYEISGGVVKEYWFTFPGKEMVKILDDLYDEMPSYEDKGSKEFDFTERIPIWREAYRPIVLVLYHGEKEDGKDVQEKLLKDICNPLVVNPEYAQEFIPSRIRALENYSHGHPVSLHVYFDEKPVEGVPTSYYWVMMNTDGTMIMNGGFIAHKRERNGETVYEYAVHT